MKTSMFLMIVMLLFVTYFLYAEERPFFSNDELTGTWIIDSYSEQRAGLAEHPQKYTIYHLGYWEIFSNKESNVYIHRGMLQISDKWTVSQGNTLYKAYVINEDFPAARYDFGRISKDGSRWEYAYSYSDFPNESDLKTENTYYLIYHRQE
jgi:hypothetical protein